MVVHLDDAQKLDLGRPEVAIGALEVEPRQRQPITACGEHLRLEPGRSHVEERSHESEELIPIEIEL